MKPIYEYLVTGYFLAYPSFSDFHVMDAETNFAENWCFYVCSWHDDFWCFTCICMYKCIWWFGYFHVYTCVYTCMYICLHILYMIYFTIFLLYSVCILHRFFLYLPVRSAPVMFAKNLYFIIFRQLPLFRRVYLFLRDWVLTAGSSQYFTNMAMYVVFV